MDRWWMVVSSAQLCLVVAPIASHCSWVSKAEGRVGRHLVHPSYYELTGYSSFVLCKYTAARDRWGVVRCLEVLWCWCQTGGQQSTHIALWDQPCGSAYCTVTAQYVQYGTVSYVSPSNVTSDCTVIHSYCCRYRLLYWYAHIHLSLLCKDLVWDKL